jgi:hypothetical protein
METPGQPFFGHLGGGAGGIGTGLGMGGLIGGGFGEGPVGAVGGGGAYTATSFGEAMHELTEKNEESTPPLPVVDTDSSSLAASSTRSHPPPQSSSSLQRPAPNLGTRTHSSGSATSANSEGYPFPQLPPARNHDADQLSQLAKYSLTLEDQEEGDDDDDADRKSDIGAGGVGVRGRDPGLLTGGGGALEHRRYSGSG